MSTSPYVPSDARLPELTVKAVVLGAVLAVVLAAANAYLGLKVGMTVSASIPAAVVSMAILARFRQANILENNLVQTAASSGEAVAAGAIFTLPALVLAGHWQTFPYPTVTCITLIGGLLGVFFSIPLRRALVVDRPLAFPEGVATAEVLKAGDRGGRGVRIVALAGAAGLAVKLAQQGLGLLHGKAVAALALGRTVWVAGAELSPALIAVGYIVRLPTAATVFAGGVLAWGIGIPLYTALCGLPAGADGAPLPAYDAAMQIWSTRIRYAGVGAMFVGGIGSLVGLLRPLARSLAQAWAVHRAAARAGGAGLARTEQDLSPPALLAGVVLTAPFAAWLLAALIRQAAPSMGTPRLALAVAVALALLLVAGLLFSAVAGYMAGIVGSSNNPISGVTLATVMVTGLALVPCLGATHDPAGAASAIAATILVAAAVCCAAAMSGDNLQDLKTGHLLGATPIKQQIMQFVGVAAGALVLSPVLSLLYGAYGLGAAMPRPGMNPAEALSAPQATLVHALARGLVVGDLPWRFIAIGAAVGAAVMAADATLARRRAGFRVPVLAVAVGIYLPLELTLPILIGGCLAGRRESATPNGLLAASGLIAGEAIAGILLAVPFALAQRTDVLNVAPPGFAPAARALGVAAVAAVAAWLWRTGRAAARA